MTATTTHPRSGEQTRLDTLQAFASQYWWLGFLGFADWINPLFALFYLCFGLIPIAVVLEWLSDDATPAAWVETREPSGIRGRVGAVLAAVHPTVMGQSLFHWVTTAVVRGRGLTPDPDEFEQTESFRLPFDGEWTVLDGSTDETFAHDHSLPQHRYAYDFVITDEDGSTYDRGSDDDSLDTHYCYGEPVLAPADGTVSRVRQNRHEPNRAAGAPALRQRSIYGNVVVIDHGDVATVLAHLQPGSITVEEGDRVERGEQIGACGQSGNASEPHLHVHVQDRSRPSVGIGLPVEFDDVAVGHPDTASTARRQTLLHCGQQIEPASAETGGDTAQPENTPHQSVADR